MSNRGGGGGGGEGNPESRSPDTRAVPCGLVVESCSTADTGVKQGGGGGGGEGNPESRSPDTRAVPCGLVVDSRVVVPPTLV